MIRVLHVVGGLDRAGVETWLVQVLRKLSPEDYRFDFLVHGDAPYHYEEEVKALGSKVIRCPIPSRPVRYARNFLRILREHGPYDCVHSHLHHFSGFVMLLAKLGGVPARVAQSHLDTSAGDQSALPMRKFYQTLMKVMIQAFATSETAVSMPAGNALFGEGWNNKERGSILPLGIDLSAFQSAVDPSQIRRSLGIPKDAFVVGHVGRFCEQKNHAFLVEVAAELVKLQPRAFFLLIGEGPLRVGIEAEIRSRRLADNFLFTGVQTQVATLMKGAMDAFIFPSRYEGFGLALLEAQAAGLPCVISETIPEEACVIRELLDRRPLSDGAGSWARALDCTRGKRNGARPNELRSYSLEHSVASLEQLYSQAHYN